MAQEQSIQPGGIETEVQQSGWRVRSPLYSWGIGVAAVMAILAASLIVWGPEMDFPTTVSTDTVGDVTLDRSLKDVTANTIDDSVDWITLKGAWLFDGISSAVTYALINIEAVLKWLPWPAVVAFLGLLSYGVGRWGLAAFTSLALLFVGFMGLWSNMIDTVALMVVAVVIAVAIGLPLGILAARNRTADYILRPILDGMQTMPSFVYLLPGILFFGLGKPAGIFATIIYAVPPVIRLTNLGIRQVAAETVEASRAFGASPWQLLTTVQIPMALPTIMAGINQTTMMALAMVTIASMVAAGGLGDDVLRALQKNQSGNGAIAGLAIVFLAIIIDRLTQSVAARRQDRLSVG
ncbi:MAG: proline/glycine betaine ABC transporter permease [Chloroflexota bacterium]|nr:proline/glycine betaine ABC transporter permease [Chloroflexota bacterium]MDE2942374.1 proline/glycine betaine ABC transporter permease [Chloroflexota bacterium]MDE3267946.1 proline/glycine betaine ABC transporter permease [Chloroflexota bacterium]